jgi:hypothetical protein
LRIDSGDHKRLYQIQLNAEESSTFRDNKLNCFDSGGFSVGSGSDTNNSGSTYVAWNWKAGGTAVSNTDGTITSSVSANTTAGFSVVTWTGTGAVATIGHSLGVAPGFIIVKQRDAVRGWVTYNKNLASNQVIYLNVTGAANTDTTAFNATAPTSSVFSVGTSADTNQSSGTYVAYCFAEVEGYSKIGSYTGNGSTDGPFIYTGFKPAWIMLRDSTNVQNWIVLDTARNTYKHQRVTLLQIRQELKAPDFRPRCRCFKQWLKMRTANSGWNTSHTYTWHLPKTLLKIL